MPGQQIKILSLRFLLITLSHRKLADKSRIGQRIATLEDRRSLQHMPQPGVHCLDSPDEDTEDGGERLREKQFLEGNASQCLVTRAAVHIDLFHLAGQAVQVLASLQREGHELLV